jgi:hypothetical protein
LITGILVVVVVAVVGDGTHQSNHHPSQSSIINHTTIESSINQSTHQSSINHQAMTIQ